MAHASAIMKRMFPTASSLLVRHRHQYQRALSSAATSAIGRPAVSPGIPKLLAPSSSRLSWQSPHPTHHRYPNNIKYLSSVAQDWDDGDDDDDGGDVHRSRGGGDGGNVGGHLPSDPRARLLPTKHSRHLPPPVCPPSRLRTEVESIFDAPIGSLIVYAKPTSSYEVKSAAEEMADAYYASDAIVQRVEYIVRGLNAAISQKSFVARNLNRGTMALDGEDDASLAGGNGDEIMTEEECFRAMLDLVERMAMEGQTYDELRRRVRMQVIDPSSANAAEDSDSSSSSDSDDSSSSDSDDEEGLSERNAEEQFKKWTDSMEENMSKVGIPKKAEAINAFVVGDDEDDTPAKNQEEYQFGAEPGITTHMYDLVLDSLACLCDKHYQSDDRASSFSDLVDLMPNGASPPELAKEILDVVLNRHWMDGGDIGLGGGGGANNPMNAIGQGVGTGAGTGAGSLAKLDLSYKNFDVRTCPTPMTFNAVLRIASNFDPAAYAEAVEHAGVLSGDMGNASPATASSGGADQLKRERERLRDVTIDTALSTYSRMQYCTALTLRTLNNSTKNATSRAALKRQARLLADNYKGKRENNVISGRNSATYAYLIRTIGNCIPPSMSRGNMTFAMYHKGCAQERIMDERVVEAMRGVGGYVEGVDTDLEDIAEGEGEGALPPPPISNGPLFDSFMQKELGNGVKVALSKGRRLRQDQNYKLRRHLEWDDTY